MAGVVRIRAIAEGGIIRAASGDKLQVFGAFKTKHVDEFADWIVAELRARHPPDGANGKRPKDVERLRKLFGRIFGRIDSFARENKLNLYTKARLANRIRWELKDAGYPEEFIEAATREVATHVALASSRGKHQAKD
jgi:hypothetical protein